MINFTPEPHDCIIEHNGMKLAIGLHLGEFKEAKCIKYNEPKGEWEFVTLVDNIDERLNNGMTPEELLNKLLDKINAKLFPDGDDAVPPIPPYIKGKFLELATLIRDNIAVVNGKLKLVL